MPIAEDDFESDDTEDYEQRGADSTEACHALAQQLD